MEMADPRLKRLVIVLDQVRCKDHHTAKLLKADEQLAAHRVNGLLRSLCDLCEPLGEQRIGFIDKKDRIISLCCMEDRLDVLGALPMKLALNFRVTGIHDRSIESVSDVMCRQSFRCPSWSMKTLSRVRKLMA